MKNLGLELIQTRFDGLTSLYIEVEGRDGYNLNVVAKSELTIKGHDEASLVEKQMKTLEKLKKYIAMSDVVVTVSGIADTVYDERQVYRISARWDGGVEVRPYQNGKYEVYHVEAVNSPRKATNYIMKVLDELITFVRIKA